MKSKGILSILASLLIISAQALGGGALTAQASPAASAPAISVSPATGTAGSSVVISGSGFDPGGYAGTIQWDGANQSTFSIPGGGVFSVSFSIPGGASPGGHTLSVCAACGDGDVEQRASTGFTVTVPPTAEIQPPPIVVPNPVIPTLPALQTPPLDIPATPSHTQICTHFDLGADAQVLTFDSLAVGARLTDVLVGNTTISFTPGSAYVGAPPVAAHSGSLAVESSGGNPPSSPGPVRFSFSSDQSAVGLYVGRPAPAAGGSGTIFAVLSAYGYDSSRNLVEIASDQVALPAEATPIQRCLVVRAPTGLGIHSLSLDYLTADDASAPDQRWMDDLTFSMQNIAADAPPSVQILLPADGSTAPSYSVDVVARIQDDHGLSSVSYSLSGSNVTSMPFLQLSSINASPGDPLTFQARSALSTGLVPGSTYELTVTATDDRGQSGQDTVNFLYQPGALGDVWITGMEVTQAIQTLDNQIPLVGNKATAVRVYVQSTEDNGGPWNRVMARLVVNGHEYSPYAVIPNRGIVVSPYGSSRVSSFGFPDSFDFQLNPEDVTPGTRSLRAEIYLLNGRAELTSANDNLSLDVTFHDPVTISFYGVAYGNLNPTLGPAPATDFEAHRAFVNAVFPASDVTILQLPGDPPIPTFDNAGPIGAYLQAEDWAGRMLATLPAGSRIYMLQPEQDRLSGKASGAGWMNGQNNRGTSAGWVMAQEVAHSYGLWWHDPGAEVSDPNYDYPYYGGQVGPQVGFNVRRMTAMPAGMRDIMSYYTPVWVSPYTYCALLAVLPGGSPCPGGVNHAGLPAKTQIAAEFAPAMAGRMSETSLRAALSALAPEKQYLYVAGIIQPDGSASLLPSQVITSSEDRTSIPPGIGFRLELRSASGQVLAGYDFEPLLTHEDPNQPQLFSLTVPYDPAMTRLVLYRGATRLAQRTASAHAPLVSLLTPNGGQNISGLQSVSWQASDADNDPLTYTLEYSADGGATWTTLNTGLTATYTDVNFDAVPGSDRALLRVTASDGLNTTFDISDAAFRVPSKGPQISLDGPADGTAFLQGMPFSLSARAFDWEDGPIDNPHSFSWSSDRDGFLGNGSWISLSNLTPGEHTLTVTVVDTAGNQASASLHVTITPLHSRLPVWVWITASLLLAAVLVAGGLLLKRRARMAA